jgi:hypothetical protein
MDSLKPDRTTGHYIVAIRKLEADMYPNEDIKREHRLLDQFAEKTKELANELGVKFLVLAYDPRGCTDTHVYENMGNLVSASNRTLEGLKYLYQETAAASLTTKYRQRLRQRHYGTDGS